MSVNHQPSLHTVYATYTIPDPEIQVAEGEVFERRVVRHT